MTLIRDSIYIYLCKQASVYFRFLIGNVLFNDALNTFYLRLYGVRDMVKYHTDSERKPDWCNQGRAMYSPVCGMVHIKDPLLLAIIHI